MLVFVRIFKIVFARQAWASGKSFVCLENKLLLTSINFTPKTATTVAWQKWYFLRFSGATLFLSLRNGILQPLISEVP